MRKHRRRAVAAWVILLAGVSILALAATLRGAALVNAKSTEPMWIWLERLSWLAGLGSLLFALAAWWTSRPGMVPSSAGLPTDGAGRSQEPSTRSIDPPLALLDVPIRGREPLLDTLFGALNGRRKSVAVHVLHGLGGTGKTTVALALAGMARKRGTLVWWVSAASETELSSGLRQVAAELGAAPADLDRAWAGLGSATDLLWRLLHQQKDRWLLLLDNADTPEWLAGAGTSVAAGTGWLRPVASDQGRIVVTSREGNPRVWGPWCKLHLVRPLEIGDAAAMLLDRVGSQAGGDDDARSLAVRLGGLPLALHLAGSYLADAARAPWPGAITSISDYHAALKSGDLHELLGSPGSDTATPDLTRRAVTRTWDMSLELLEQRGMGQSRNLLYLLSMLADAPIPYHAFLHAPTLATHTIFEETTTERLRSLLTALAYLGLVELPSPQLAANDRRLPLLRIHPLVREVGQLGAAAADSGTEYFSLTVALMYRIAEEEGTAGAENVVHRPLWESLSPHCFHLVARVPHIAGLPIETVAQLARAATLSCTYLYVRGEQRQADTNNRMVIAACTSALGEDHPTLLAARHTTASILQSSGHFSEAEVEYCAVLAARRRVLGDEHPQTLTTRHQIAYLMAELGRFDAAEVESRDVLEIFRGTLGAEHFRTLITWHLLGYVLLRRGSLDAAEAELGAVAEKQHAILGPLHWRTLRTRSEIAEIAYQRDQLEVAERSSSELIDAQQRLLGPTHSDTIRTRILLCRVWDAECRYSEAAAELASLEEGALNGGLDEVDPLMLAIRDLQAQVLHHSGQYADARRRYEAVLALRVRVFGQDHPDTVATKRHLASLDSRGN